jgi:hypothetical protein
MMLMSTSLLGDPKIGVNEVRVLVRGTFDIK